MSSQSNVSIPCALAVFACAATAQFTAPYSGVGPARPNTDLPIVVMRYEPDTPFDHVRYALFGRDGNNRLQQIAKDRGSPWYKRVEIPFVPSRVPASDPVAFRNPDGNVASIFVTGTDERVYQNTVGRAEELGAWRGWAALPNNVRIATGVAAVNTPGGLGVTVVGVGADGLLYNCFYSRPSSSWGNWSQVPLSPQLSATRPVAVNSANGNELHVFAVDAVGALRHVRYLRGGSGGWTLWSTFSGPTVVGAPACYVHGSLLSVLATGSDSVIRQSVYSNGSASWGAWNSLGRPVSGVWASGPAVVNSPNGETFEVVARNSAGELEKKVYDRPTSSWSGWSVLDIGGPLASGPAIANWHTRRVDTAFTRDQFFGAGESAKTWFDENSQGNYRVHEAIISDWLVMPDDPSTAVDESSYEYFHGGDFLGKARIMIEAFEGLTGFSFAPYDTNGDSRVTRDELMVFMVYPGEGARVRAAPVCVNVPSISGCGIALDLGLPRAACHIGAATVCEELCHALFGFDDLYPTPSMPNYVGPGRLSLISNNAAFPHLHPWGKLKLGWVPPTVVTQDGWYRLRPIETNPDLLVVHDPARGPRDYFLVENRWPDMTIEHALPDRGIGVWRIGEHYAGQANWGRKTIKLLRAGGGTDDRYAFWDAAQPVTGYHLTPSSMPANTSWDGGGAGSIAIYHFPTAGPVAHIFVDVPPLRSSPPPPRVGADYTYINQPAPFQNQSPTWLSAMSLPRIGGMLDVRVPASSVMFPHVKWYFLLTGASNPRSLLPDLDGYLMSSGDTAIELSPFGQPGQNGILSLPIPADPQLSGLAFYQQVILVDSSRGVPLSVSRGGRMLLGY